MSRKLTTAELPRMIDGDFRLKHFNRTPQAHTYSTNLLISLVYVSETFSTLAFTAMDYPHLGW